MHGIQAWVALPRAHEEDEPEFKHYEGAEQLPEWQDHGVQARLIAGALDGLEAQVSTHSLLFYLHLDMAPGAFYQLGTEYSEQAIYVAQGEIEVDGQRLQAGQMLVLPEGQSAHLRANKAAIVMLLGGEPVGERFIYWNFVSSSKERIEQAKADWLAQRMKLPVDDNQEFVPLPGS